MIIPDQPPIKSNKSIGLLLHLPTGAVRQVHPKFLKLQKKRSTASFLHLNCNWIDAVLNTKLYTNMNNSKTTCWIILHPPLGKKQKAELRRRKRSWSASSTENRERRVGLEGSRIESHETSRLVVVFSWRFVDFGMRCLDLPTYIWHTHYAGKSKSSAYKMSPRV